MILLGLLIGYLIGLLSTVYVMIDKRVKINYRVTEVTENVFSPKLGKRITNNVN